MIAIGAQYRHARYVLRGHGDNEQRNADAEQRLNRQCGRGPDRLRQRPVELLQMQLPGQCRHQHADQQGDWNHVAREHQLAGQIAGQHQTDQQGLLLQRTEQIEPEWQQHPRQHGTRQRGWYQAHDAVEPAQQAAEGNQRGVEQKNANRLIQAETGQAGRQERATGRTPGDQHRRAKAQ